MDSTVNVPELVERLGSDEDPVRKMAAFKLQNNIGDPSFADVFIYEGGMTKLRYLTLNATGNTLAYSLTAFSRLLDVDKGWDCVDQDLVKRVVELVVTHPLVNILRGAMSILVAVVSHPHSPNRSSKSPQPDLFGFRALKPSIAAFPEFLEMLVSRLSSADHALCANALQLINSLMRDAITTGAENEWPKFIKRLQDLGVIRAVYGLMQSSSFQDLGQPLAEFQALTKVLLRKWRDVAVDFDKSEHRRAIRAVYQASKSEDEQRKSDNSGSDPPKPPSGSSGTDAEKWARLGFATDSPAAEFEDVGFLGMMDLSDYVRRNEDGFQKLMLEQATKPVEARCPVARASISVTSILYEHFDIEKADLDDVRGVAMALDSRSNIDRVFKPMLLQWSRLHTSGLQAFLRLWKATGAEVVDFSKIAELVRILLEAVVGGAGRTKEITAVEDEIQSYELARLRELQMELLELSYEDRWGQHLRQVREELGREALEFIKEQRVRCLLAGMWFPLPDVETSELEGDESEDHTAIALKKWRFAKLSHNRRWLHYEDYEDKKEPEPTLEELGSKVDLSTVSSVISNVSADPSSPSSSTAELNKAQSSQDATARNAKHAPQKLQTRIVINGYITTNPASALPGTSSGAAPSSSHRKNPSTASQTKEVPLLALHPSSKVIASEWLDGLLMLLNQAPITSETNKLLKTITNWGLKIRLLNVRFDEDEDEDDDDDEHEEEPLGRHALNGVNGSAAAASSSAKSKQGEEPRKLKRGEVPSREGLDENYYYDIGGV